jgi:hypothetical protein
MIRVPKTEEYKFTFFIEHQNRYGYLNEPTEGHVRIDGEERTLVNLYPSNEKLYVFHLLEPSGSLIPITPINRSHIQLIKNIPEALFNTLFRPLPTDPPSKIEKWYFVLENWFIYALILVGVFIKRTQFNTKQQSFIVFIVVFTILLSLLIGWITPVIGAIIRYKIPIVFLLIGLGWLLLYAKNEQKCQKQY